MTLLSAGLAFGILAAPVRAQRQAAEVEVPRPSASSSAGSSVNSVTPAAIKVMATPSLNAAPAAMPPSISAALPAAALVPQANPGAAAQPQKEARVAPPGGRESLRRTAGDVAKVRGDQVGDDTLLVDRALRRVFDADVDRGDASLAGVSARAQGARSTIARKVGVANSASPADAPALYQDAIETARKAFPASVAEQVAKIVRGYAAHKAEASLGDLAAAAYQVARSGAKTNRFLTALDTWEKLLGTPGRPLVANAEALKSDVRDFAANASRRSAPHVWFSKADGAFTAQGLPGAAVPGVAKISLLVASFKLSPTDLGPSAVLSEAYRAYASDPRAANGAGLIYRSRRAMGTAVPLAAFSASRFWLRAALETLWRRVFDLFARAPGREALRRDAALAREAAAQSAAAERLLAAPVLRVGSARAAFAALARAAGALEQLSGGSARAVADLNAAFEASARRLPPGAELPAELTALVSGPGGLAHWSRRVREDAERALDERFARARTGAESVDLGARPGAAAAAAAMVAEMVRTRPAAVSLDERLWLSGSGAHGAVRLSADLRATQTGGFVELLVERGDEALSRRLGSLGFYVLTTREGLRATLGSEDAARGAEDLSVLVAYAFALAGGREEVSDRKALDALVAGVRDDSAASSTLARSLDGRADIAAAPVIGQVGEYEAVGPVAANVGRKPVLIYALRDPDTGLSAYARAIPLAR